MASHWEWEAGLRVLLDPAILIVVGLDRTLIVRSTGLQRKLQAFESHEPALG